MRLLKTLGISFFFLGGLLWGASPEGVQKRLGVYAWGAMRQGSPDPLLDAVADAKALGAKVFRTPITPYWDPRDPTGASADRRPLYEKIWRSDYQYLLESMAVVVLTAYDSASFPAKYREPIDLSDEAAATKWQKLLEAVEEENFRFVYAIAQKISGTDTEVRIGNWESENDCSDSVWSQCLAYHQAAINGRVRGREAAARDGYPAKIFTFFEFRHVEPGFKDAWSPDAPRAHSGFQSAIREMSGVDILSLSAWAYIYHTDDFGFGYTRRQLESAFRLMRESCAEAGNPCRIMIGEAGYLWEYENPAKPGSLMRDEDGRNLRDIIATCFEQGADLVINWVTYDQPGQGVSLNGKFYDQSKFGNYKPNGELTPQGLALRNWFANGF